MIDLIPVRNYLRREITLNGIFAAEQIAYEGRDFNPTKLTAYLEEVFSVDEEGLDFSVVEYAIATFSYNVYITATSKPSDNSVEYAECKRIALAKVFSPQKVSFKVGNLQVMYCRTVRRPAVNDGGWRIAPLDLTVKVTEVSPIIR